MARKDALLRLHQQLVAKRDHLRAKISSAMGFSNSSKTRGSDLGDVAHEGEQNEINSQLASLESRELKQIERALEQLKTGRYGICDGCDSKIPVSRLNVLPYTSLCVNCQREMEESGQLNEQQDGNWDAAYEFEGRLEEREYTMRDLDHPD